MIAIQAADYCYAPRVAVIGAGASGAILAMELLRGPRWFGALTLIEKGARLGPGRAYGTGSDAHVLNSRAANMSVAGEAGDFTAWLRDRGAEDIVFAKRSEFGVYLEQRLAAALRSAPGHTHVVQGEAIALERAGRHWRISFADAAPIEADIVVLALGNQTPSLPRIFESVDLADGQLIRDPWDNAALNRIAPHENVLLLGTGMTMVDAALALSTRPRTGRIFALSRRGLMPHAHDLTSVGVVRRTLPSRMSEALREVRARAAAADEAGHSWRDVMDELRPALPDIWRRLPREARHRFLRHARPHWDTHRHRLAPCVAERIEALEQTGALVALAGRVQGLAASGDSVRVDYLPRGARELGSLNVTRIINCTGPCANVKATRNSLLRALVEQGAVRGHDTGLGLDVADDGALINANGAAHTSLFALGPLTQGAFWESTAIPEIRARASALARRLTPLSASWRTAKR
jgi:uncharacterized NAD(P)/FAD-binding protein YdhS